MTVQILKSQIQDEAAFRDALEKLRQAKIDHMMSEAVGVPPPSDPILDQFIKRTPTGPDTPDEFTIDYEIINDDPTEAEVRAKALANLRAAEAAEIEAVLPEHKRRLMQMEFSRASYVLEVERTPEQQKTVDDWQELQKKIYEIQYAAVLREAEL